MNILDGGPLVKQVTERLTKVVPYFPAPANEKTTHDVVHPNHDVRGEVISLGDGAVPNGHTSIVGSCVAGLRLVLYLPCLYMIHGDVHLFPEGTQPVRVFLNLRGTFGMAHVDICLGARQFQCLRQKNFAEGTRRLTGWFFVYVFVRVILPGQQ